MMNGCNNMKHLQTYNESLRDKMKPVPEEDVKYLEDIFNKDIYALCDIPVLGYSAWKVQKADSKPRCTPPEILPLINRQAPTTLAIGPKAAAGKGMWENTEASLQQFIDTLHDHAEGKKDGSCFTQGEVAGRVRTAKAVIKNYIIGFDLDTGESAEEIDERLAPLGYSYVRYTTYSHLSNTSEVKRDPFFKRLGEDASFDATPEQVSAYLVDWKGYRADVLTNIKIKKQAQTSDEGVLIIVKHKPIEKHSIITRKRRG